jgi:hypothetical protein
MLSEKDFAGGHQATLIQDQARTRNLDSKNRISGFENSKIQFHSSFLDTFSTASTQTDTWLIAHNTTSGRIYRRR